MAMSFEQKIMKTAQLVKNKLDKNYEAQITYTGDKMVWDENSVSDSKDFFFKSYDNGNSWTVYQGCELLIGDTSLNTCVMAMLDACNERLVNIWTGR